MVLQNTGISLLNIQYYVIYVPLWHMIILCHKAQTLIEIQGADLV